MIVSPPFLVSPTSQTTREMHPADAGDTAVPDHDVCMSGLQECEPGNGAYPVSYNLGWHGGTHLIAPIAANGHTEPVRAIADGQVVYVRPTSSVESVALQYRNVRTDDGCVVIRHTTEIGEGDRAKVTFFSIYMHLQSVVGAIAVGKSVYRKDLLGVAGQIYGQPGQMHFEIVCNGANLQKLVGRATGLLTGRQGRTDAIYGDIWFKVPKGAKIFANQPHPYRRDDSEPPLGPDPSVQSQRPLGSTGSDLYVRMHYGMGDCTLTTFELGRDGTRTPVGEPSTAGGYEYDLYMEATRLNTRYTDGSTAPANPSPKTPSPSLIYEMLRFGRPVGETMPSDVKFGHWRRIATPEGIGWVNLNQPKNEGYYGATPYPGIGVYSDADFPHWAGWSLIDDDGTPQSLCTSPTIRQWLDLDGDGQVTHAEAVQALHHDNVKKRMAQAICKFPIEWSKTSIEARWGWLKSPHEALSAPLSSEDFAALEAHIKALAFWEEMPSDPDLPTDDDCWHFPPKAFIQHFRKCGWLAYEELLRAFPSTALRYQAPHIDDAHHVQVPGHWVSESVTPSTANIEKYRIELNKAMRKFLIVTPLRQAAFLANAMQETQWFSLMEEGGASNQKYYPWFGHGFMQLTWPDNYIKYWRFCGRPIASDLAERLHQAVVATNTNGSNADLMTADMQVPASMKVWRKSVGSAPFDATDSAGAYWAWTGSALNADQTPALQRETEPVENTQKPYYSCQSFGLVAATVNVGHPSSAFSHINGLQARYQAYTAALVQLMDVMQFPRGNGTFQSSPNW